MRINLTEEKREYIMQMFKAGMKVGEIQAIFPTIDSTTLHRIGKNLGIETRIRKNKSNIEERNTQDIKDLLEKGIKEGIIIKNEKVEILLNMIDKVAPTPNGRAAGMRKALRYKTSEKQEEKRKMQEQNLMSMGEEGYRRMVEKSFKIEDREER